MGTKAVLAQNTHRPDMQVIEDMELEESARRPWPASCDLVFSNLERQSFFDPEECQGY